LSPHMFCFIKSSFLLKTCCYFLSFSYIQHVDVRTYNLL
jgi:hypothetical protein